MTIRVLDQVRRNAERMCGGNINPKTHTLVTRKALATTQRSKFDPLRVSPVQSVVRNHDGGYRPLVADPNCVRPKL